MTLRSNLDLFIHCMRFTHVLHSLALLVVLPALATTAPPATITSATTGAPIPYASLGIQNKPIGTVADGFGHFAINQFSLAATTDTLVITCVGYIPRKVLMADLDNLNELQLTPQAQSLAEVVVQSPSWQRHRIGRDGAWGITYYNFHLQVDKEPANKLGREVGAILHVQPGSYIEDAHFYVGQNNFKNVRFRLNVRALDAEDHPAASLLTRDVQVAVPNRTTGWQHIDLKQYDVKVGPNKRVAVTLEWLDGVPDGQRSWYCLMVPAAMSATHRMIFRDKSEDQWKMQPLNLSLYVTTLSPK